jgi:hypothetical protein
MARSKALVPFAELLHDQQYIEKCLRHTNKWKRKKLDMSNQPKIVIKVAATQWKNLYDTG